MRNIKSILGTLSLAGIIGIGTFATATPVTAMGTTAVSEAVKVGQPVPDFKLKGTDGKEHSLSDFKGKLIVVQFINPDCPVCRRVISAGVVKNMLTKVKAIDSDFVFMPINSTSYMAGEAKPSKDYLEKNKIDAVGLLDPDGTVGRELGAQTTPHMYVIDAKGVLRYSGAIDNDRNGRMAKSGKDVDNYVVMAVESIKNGSAVEPSTTRPYGCSVKYKK